MPPNTDSPSGAADSRADFCRPLRGCVRSVHRRPGARAPGLGLPPLAGLVRISSVRANGAFMPLSDGFVVTPVVEFYAIMVSSIDPEIDGEFSNEAQRSPNTICNQPIALNPRPHMAIGLTAAKRRAVGSEVQRAPRLYLAWWLRAVGL